MQLTQSFSRFISGFNMVLRPLHTVYFGVYHSSQGPKYTVRDLAGVPQSIHDIYQTMSITRKYSELDGRMKSTNSGLGLHIYTT